MTYAGVNAYGLCRLRFVNRWWIGYCVSCASRYSYVGMSFAACYLHMATLSRKVPCGIAIFRWHYHVSPTALQMLPAQSHAQTDQILAEWQPLQSIWLFWTSNLTNDARWTLDHTQLQDVAGSMSLIVLSIKAANETNKENDVPKLIFCT